jgi:hypothetical protein
MKPYDEKAKDDVADKKSMTSADMQQGLELWNVIKENVKNKVSCQLLMFKSLAYTLNIPFIKTLLDPEALKATGSVPSSFSTSILADLTEGNPNFFFLLLNETTGKPLKKQN